MNHFGGADTPILVENGMRNYLDRTLKTSKLAKAKYTNVLYNVGFTLVLVLVVGGFLLYKYKGKLSPYERYKKQEESRHYILSKLQRLAGIKAKENGGSITGLPTW
tara:strand:+ start:1346 stop:1663 length:318 start_codon:yes stop_codon:yes gene_type:complete